MSAERIGLVNTFSESVGERLRELAAETAVELERVCTEQGADYATEAKHLHPCCKTVIQRLTLAWQPSPSHGPTTLGRHSLS